MLLARSSKSSILEHDISTLIRISISHSLTNQPQILLQYNHHPHQGMSLTGQFLLEGADREGHPLHNSHRMLDLHVEDVLALLAEDEHFLALIALLHEDAVLDAGVSGSPSQVQHVGIELGHPFGLLAVVDVDVGAGVSIDIAVLVDHSGVARQGSLGGIEPALPGPIKPEDIDLVLDRHSVVLFLRPLLQDIAVELGADEIGLHLSQQFHLLLVVLATPYPLKRIELVDAAEFPLHPHDGPHPLPVIHRVGRLLLVTPDDQGQLVFVGHGAEGQIVRILGIVQQLQFVDGYAVDYLQAVHVVGVVKGIGVGPDFGAVRVRRVQMSEQELLADCGRGWGGRLDMLLLV